MNWFGGSIPEAIGLAKSTDAIFVVYIHDSSDASKTTDESLAQKELASRLSSKKFVAIKLENGTEPANQFSQIYPVVVLPSLYFISGSTGMPLEILGGAVTNEKLKEKLDQLTNGPEGAAEKQEQESSASAPEEMIVDEPNETPVLPSTSEVQMETSCSSEGASLETPAVVDNSQVSEVSGNTVDKEDEVKSMEEDDDDATEVALEERLERARILLAEKQAKKTDESIEDEKKKEKERRKMGQEIAKRKRQTQEEEIQSLVRERKKEKDEDRAARERIRAQIAADRLEAQARAALFKEEPASAPVQEPPGNVGAAAAPAPVRNNTVTRLKFRLLDGSSNVAEFPAEATLADVRRHVQQHLVSSSGFSLTSTVHQHPFTGRDNESTLSELGLVPSAILIVSNSSGSGSGSLVPSQGGIMQFFWMILSPITFILGFVRQLFSSITGGGSNSSSSSTAQAGSSQTTNQQRPST
ncbi:UBX domain-containing protein 4-like isoform X2 [Palaemon carinicauda]